MSEEVSRAVRPFLLHRGAALVLAAGLAVSVGLWRHAEHATAREALAHFSDRASLVLARIEQRVEEYRTLLLGMQGLFLTSEEVGRREFHRYASNLQVAGRAPGIRALHFTRHVRHEDKSRAEAAVRTDRSVDRLGYPDFSIHPEGRREEYYVIEYIEPLAENRSAFGLDVGTQVGNRESFLSARDSGQANISPPFQLAQTGPGEIGLVMRAPVYRYGWPLDSVRRRREAFLGFVGISLDPSQLFKDVFAEAVNEGMAVRVRDAGSAAPQSAPAEAQLIADTDVPSGAASALTVVRRLTVGERQWEVTLIAGEDWIGNRSGRLNSMLFLGGGATISLLLAALVAALTRSNQRAIEFAEKMTHDLRQSEQRFRVLAEMSTDWFWEQDADNRFTRITGSEASSKMPLALETIKGKTRWEVTPEAFSEAQWAAHRHQLAARELFELEYPIVNQEGKRRWLLVRGTPYYDIDGGFLGYHGTAQDVTERKRAIDEIASKTAVLQATLENMDQGISVADRDLRLIGYNRRFLELLEFPESLTVGSPKFEDFIRYNAQRGEYGPGPVEELVQQKIELARRFEPHKIKRMRPNGTVLEIIGAPMPDGGFVTTYTDVTERERAEEAIKRQSAILQTTLDHLEQGVSVIGPDLQMMAMNRRFCEVLDFPEEMARAGGPFEEFFRFNAMRGEYGPGDVEEMVRERVEMARRSQPHHFKRVRPNGRVIEVRGTPIAGGGFVTTYTDITEQEHAQEAVRQSERRYRTLVEMSPDAVLVHRGRTILLANEAAQHLCAMPGGVPLVSRDLLEFIHPDSQPEVLRRIELLERDADCSSRVRFSEQVYRRADGTAVPVESSATRIELADGPAVLSVVRDISVRKEAEDTIRRINETLEQRVRERTAELEASNQELESFSYSVSHDLRAPLRALHGYSHLLEEEYVHKLDDSGLHYLRRIRAASERMGKLIDDLIDLARVSRQELKRIRVDLGTLAGEVIESIQECDAQRAVTWSVAPQLSAWADPVLMKTLLDNLLSNAWKFTAEREHAHIEFGRKRMGDEDAFFIRDNGAGLEMAYADKLFQPFQRLHDAKRFEGTGVGLATVRRIVARHGGRIWAEGAPGQGATFYFVLP